MISREPLGSLQCVCPSRRRRHKFQDMEPITMALELTVHKNSEDSDQMAQAQMTS